jgi:hypothetical protein
MSTTVLAYLIVFMGFITFLCGAFGDLDRSPRFLRDNEVFH